MTQPAAPVPAPDDRPHKMAGDTEEVYFEGSPLLRAEMGQMLLWSLGALVLLAIAVAGWLYDWHFPWWLTLGLVVVAGILFCMPMMLRKTLRYRITNYRVDITTGVLSRNVNTLELWHVEEPRLHQSLLNRIVGVGTIILTSHDPNMPKMTLVGLPKPQELFRLIEQRVIAVKRQPGVMKVDAG